MSITQTPRATTRPLRDPTFRKLFAAQILSLSGIGLLTIGLALVAWEIGGPAAGGQVLGLLLALKMVAYLGFARFVETLLPRFPRKGAMVGLDVGRMLLLVPMAFAGAPWQIAALAFAFFVLSAGFTPLFQSVIPDVLPAEDDYTRALALSRLAYTLEYVDEMSGEDVVFEEHGVKVLVDPKSMAYIDGTQLDYVREGLNEGFRFNNPNERDKCGCGESFRV